MISEWYATLAELRSYEPILRKIRALERQPKHPKIDEKIAECQQQLKGLDEVKEREKQLFKMICPGVDEC